MFVYLSFLLVATFYKWDYWVKWYTNLMYYIHICRDMGFLGSSAGKESACNAGDLGEIPGSGRSPGEGIDYSLQSSCLENAHGQRSLAGYSPWGHKVLDTTERLSTAQDTIYYCTFTFFLQLPLKGLMLKLKLQYFGYLIPWTDSLEKTLILGKIEGRRRRGRQKTRWLDGITDSMDMILRNL